MALTGNARCIDLVRSHKLQSQRQARLRQPGEKTMSLKQRFEDCYSLQTPCNDMITLVCAEVLPRNTEL